MRRVTAGRGSITTAPRRAAVAAVLRGTNAAPAPASTSGMVASRCAVSKAMRTSAPTEANASSSLRRLEVP